jgi:hypothetical protein
MKKYVYPTLPDGKSVRMLILNPGERDDPLKGTIECVGVDSLGSYEPLSYVWGVPKFDYTISIQDENGDHERMIELTPSLYGALKRLRLPNQTRRLWADQICINQSSNLERSQQVQFMNRIYKHASRVLVWLGADDKGLAKSAFDLVQELYKTLENEAERENFRVAYTENLEQQSRDRWDALDHLTDLPWVSWGVQPF